MGISLQQILIVLLVGVVLFGASKLPQIGEGMGKAIRNFKRSLNGVEEGIEDITPNKKISKKEGEKADKEEA